MKKALIYLTLDKGQGRTPYFVFIYNEGEIKIVGNELTMGGQMMVAQMKNLFASLGPSEREKVAAQIFDEFSPATPGYRMQSIIVDYEGADKKMADEMFDKLSSRNFDNAKRKKDG
jgi:hypothetical protein